MLEPRYLFKSLPSLYLIRNKLPWGMENPRGDRTSLPYVTDFGTRVRIKDVSNRQKDVILVKANHSIPQDCPFFYFETTIESFGSGTSINLGLTNNIYREGHYIGQDRGYSVILSTDMRPHHAQSKSILRLLCKVNDVIGMGINNIKHSIFITKNGEKQEINFCKITLNEYYPAVFMDSSNSSILFNFGHEDFYYDINNEIKPIIDEVRTISYIPPNDPDPYGCITMLESIFDYMNARAFTQTSNEIAKYLTYDPLKVPETIQYSHNIYKNIHTNEFMDVYNKIITSNLHLEQQYPSCYLGMLCLKFYNDAFALTTSDVNNSETQLENEMLKDLIIQAESIEEVYSKIFKPEYLDTQHKIDECGLTYLQWKTFIQNLIELMCFTDSSKFQEFDKCYKMRQKIWVAVFHVLNYGKSSILDIVAMETLKNFEMGILKNELMAHFGFTYTLDLYQNKLDLEFF